MREDSAMVEEIRQKLNFSANEMILDYVSRLRNTRDNYKKPIKAGSQLSTEMTEALSIFVPFFI